MAEEVAEEFVKALCKEFDRQIGKDPIVNGEYPRLINAAAFDKCSSLAAEYRERIIHGGRVGRLKLWLMRKIAAS